MDLKTKLLLSIYKDKSYQDFFNRVGGDYGDDLCQYIAEFVMGLKPEFFNQFEDNDRFRYWVYGIAHRSMNQGTSDFRRDHFSRKDIHPDDLKQDEYDYKRDADITIVTKLIDEYDAENKDNWYDVMMLRKYIEYGGGYGAAREITRRTGIPYSSVRASLSFMKKEIKKRYERITGV